MEECSVGDIDRDVVTPVLDLVYGSVLVVNTVLAVFMTSALV